MDGVKCRSQGLDKCCKSGTVDAVSTRKILCIASLPVLLAVGSAFALLGSSNVEAETTVAEVDEETLARAQAFDGEYVFAGGQKERDGVDAAVEASVAGLNPMVRNMGRTRLQEANGVPQRVVIDVNGERVDVSFDGASHETSLDGVAIKTESREGEKVKVSHRMRGAQLFELIDGVGGDRSNEFKLSSDGTRLTMSVEISSSQLPVPVVYKLTYKRK
jgi:hypothetical protein